MTKTINTDHSVSSSAEITHLQSPQPPLDGVYDKAKEANRARKLGTLNHQLQKILDELQHCENKNRPESLKDIMATLNLCFSTAKDESLNNMQWWQNWLGSWVQSLPTYRQQQETLEIILNSYRMLHTTWSSFPEQLPDQKSAQLRQLITTLEDITKSNPELSKWITYAKVDWLNSVSVFQDIIIRELYQEAQRDKDKEIADLKGQLTTKDKEARNQLAEMKQGFEESIQNLKTELAAQKTEGEEREVQHQAAMEAFKEEQKTQRRAEIKDLRERLESKRKADQEEMMQKLEEMFNQRFQFVVPTPATQAGSVVEGSNLSESEAIERSNPCRSEQDLQSTDSISPPSSAASFGLFSSLSAASSTPSGSQALSSSTDEERPQSPHPLGEESTYLLVHSSADNSDGEQLPATLTQTGYN